MEREKPPPIRLSDLVPGHGGICFALLAERIKSTTREGKPYYQCRFRDNRRTVALMVWADSKWYAFCERDWAEGEFYKLEVVYGEHERYGPQIELRQIRPVTDADHAAGFNPSDFVQASRFDRDAMFQELRELANGEIADVPLRRLVLTLLDRHEPRFKLLPATLGKFHPFAGGLLEHTLAVTRNCLHLVDRYRAYYQELNPPLNRDLVVAGAILHDIGRVAEFGESVLAPEPTVAGRLFGHLFLGRDLVRDAARELGDVDPQLLELLEHLIVTHLTLPEWGSPRLPLIPEVLILHHLDDLDAKLEMYVRCLVRDTNDGPFTARDPVLNRPLLKGRNV